MTFLPIARRELRVAARRHSTVIIRAAAALLGIVIGGFWMLAFQLAPPSSHTIGAWMFRVLAWYTLLISLLAGTFLASDCLSEERREGTLGFLFLTDLKGYDVVAGKFLAVSLNAFYGLLAVFPVLGLALIVGGVSVAEFARTCLALVNVLFFSVALAIWVSARCRSAYRAMIESICLLLLVIVGARIVFYSTWHSVAALSPFEAFWLAWDANYIRLGRDYWISLCVSHLAGWLLLGLAAWRLKSSLGQEEKAWFPKWKPAIGRASRRARLLEINPVLWLLDDSRHLRWVAWVLGLAGAVVLMLALGAAGPEAALFMGWAVWPFYFLLKLFFAILACRFFSEARRTGSLELLCCTPVTMQTIVRGQWMALRRVFLWPVVVLLSTHIFVYDACVLRGGDQFSQGFLLWQAFGSVPKSIADFFAIGWFGMWLALSLRKPAMAAGLTILYVLILPMIAFCVPTLLTDAVFIIIGSSKLSKDFRLRAAPGMTGK
jgi:ABC-type transport system involved in multi-copper enzyme maturation permease subunit